MEQRIVQVMITYIVTDAPVDGITPLIVNEHQLHALIFMTVPHAQISQDVTGFNTPAQTTPASKFKSYFLKFFLPLAV